MSINTPEAQLERIEAQARAEGRGHFIDAHTHTTRHRKEIEASAEAGCFYCCEVFPPSEIENWLANDDCALCPYCSIDSVIGDASGYPVTDKKFLGEMHAFWFSSRARGKSGEKTSILFSLLGCLLAASPIESAKASPTPTIPAAFRGEWDETLADCATRRSDGHVTVAARHIRFYAGDADLTSRSKGTARSVTLGLDYSNESEIVHRLDKFALSPSGNTLTISSKDGRFTKQRCPARK